MPAPQKDQQTTAYQIDEPPNLELKLSDKNLKSQQYHIKTRHDNRLTLKILINKKKTKCFL